MYTITEYNVYIYIFQDRYIYIYQISIYDLKMVFIFVIFLCIPEYFLSIILLYYFNFLLYNISQYISIYMQVIVCQRGLFSHTIKVEVIIIISIHFLFRSTSLAHNDLHVTNQCTHTRAHTHARAHTCTYTRAHVRAHTHAHACNMCIMMSLHARAHSCTHIHIQMYSN